MYIGSLFLILVNIPWRITAVRARHEMIVKAMIPKEKPMRRETEGSRYAIDFLKVRTSMQFKVIAPTVRANANADEMISRSDLFLSEQRVNTTHAIANAVKVNAIVRIRLVNENVGTV